MSALSKQGDDIGQCLPMHGVRLIEASAGTGKTFTLTTLVLRLLLERSATMAQVLAVTFTRAATQELRQRIRRRLRLAKRLIDTALDTTDDEAAATAAVLRDAVARDGISRVRERVDAALLQLDEATVSTIHGFCHRVLREFGFRAGLLAEQEVVDDAGDVWDAVAADLWRTAANRLPGSDEHDLYPLMSTLWNSPDEMAKLLPKLCDPLRVVHPQRTESANATALHVLRDAATERFDAAMAQRGLCEQDRLIERVWRASQDRDFASALAERWPFILIDEFQDTDLRQWDIFQRIYEAGDASIRWLCLIGDPKQAIYRFRGGDLATYLRARQYVIGESSEAAVFELGDNYRSSPAVLRAIDTVFRASPLPFIEEGVAFRTVQAAGSAGDDDLQIDGASVPGMTVHWLPAAPRDHKAEPNTALRKGVRKKDDEFAMMRNAATLAVSQLLAAGTLRERGVERRVRPADIAVLTSTNDQAAEMQRALVRAGIAAATLSGANVFTGEAAEELHGLLASLLEPADASRFRAALSTRLLGCDAQTIAALEHDDDALQRLQARFSVAAEIWRARGPMPALLPFIVAAAPRWLGEHSGARRLTDALHLAELLQAESALRPGATEQLSWFAQQRSAESGDETRQLRLESDAGMVQISTIHKSKGLEYPIVVLPFVAWRGDRTARGLGYEDFNDAQGRPARAWQCKGVLESAQAEIINSQVVREEQAEAQRQLYVALTRAKHALHVVWSRNDSVETSAMHWLLHAGERVGRVKDTLDHDRMQARLERLASDSQGSIVIRHFEHDTAAPRTAPIIVAPESTLSARTAKRKFGIEARLHSFSSLHARSEDGEALRGAEDEGLSLPEDDENATLGGTAFGNAVHMVLESTDAAAWRRDAMAQGSLLDDYWPESQRALLEHSLLRQGLSATPAHLAQTARLVSRALNVVLPGDVRLCELPAAQQIRELPFHFRLRPVRIDAIHALLQAHGYPRARRPAQATLDGLMHGFIDLVYRDTSGRHYVLDYKTNRLPGYDADSLRRSVRVQDYDLQYLIYLVALRRWLRFRLGERYDDARHLGGAVYLFLRGVDLRETVASGESRRGVHVDPVPVELLVSLDALFDGDTGGGDQ